MPPIKSRIWFVVAAFAAVLLVQAILAEGWQVRRIAYSEFEAGLREGRIAEVTISRNYLQGTLKAPDAEGHTRFITARVRRSGQSKLLPL